MSQSCPLCGKPKSEDELFCPDCKKKIKTEYEVDVPDNAVQAETSPVPSQENAPETTTALPPDEPLSREETKYDAMPGEKTAGKKRKGMVFLWILLAIALAVGAFFAYNYFVKKQNLERSAWETAIRENTVDGYLTYMNSYPQGAHVGDAQTKMMTLKGNETAAWENLKASKNTSEFNDFLKKYPDSPYRKLVIDKLDSLTWIATLNTNTAQGYSDYMVASDSKEISGNYYAEAQERYEMLFQSYPITTEEMDKIKLTVDGFYSALSALDYNKLNEYLAPTVYRFFNSGVTSREKITGELLVSGAKAKNATIKFTPDINSLQYQKTFNGRYISNVPLSKSYVCHEGNNITNYGYIVHIEMDGEFKIIGIYETKPFADAP